MFDKIYYLVIAIVYNIITFGSILVQYSTVKCRNPIFSLPMIKERIKSLDEVNALTKHERIVNTVQDCLSDGSLNKGDILPSVNELSNSLGYARETIVKAYASLKERGIVNSKQGVGYFISHDDVDQKLSIALVLYGFQIFQQTFYNKLRKTLGDQYHLDVFFHHNNLAMYSSIINQVKGQYGMYVVAPIQDKKGVKILSELPKKKLLLVDRYQYVHAKVSHITQEFDSSLPLILEKLSDKFDKYNQINLFYKDNADYPEEIYTSLKKYCKSNKKKLIVHREYESGLIQKGQAYVTVGDGDLWELLRDCRSMNLAIGTDVGILSHNDSPVKEIIEGGITTFSTNFKDMAQEAAEYILERKSTKKIIPIELIDRGSL